MTAATPNERTFVEERLIAQLTTFAGLRWRYLCGKTGDIYQLVEGRRDFREVLLPDPLRAALRRINRTEHDEEWLDEERIATAVHALERVGTGKLLEANQRATELILRGVPVEGPPAFNGKSITAKFIDFDHPERNDFLVVNQLRIDGPGATGNKGFIVPDAILFVNGIPLVVIECKSPERTNPIEEAITQFRRYANQRDEVEQDEGAEALFHFVQVLVASSFYQARSGTISSGYEHFLAWKDTSPVPQAEVAKELGKTGALDEQEVLTAGMLRPEHLLDIVRNFTLVMPTAGGQLVKTVCRYQQFRAVHATVGRLITGNTRLTDPDRQDRRGGIVWHTQGSGKSLTMVFLVRKLRTVPQLRRFKVVIVTDRTDLERQLAETAGLTGETVRTAASVKKLKSILAENGPDLVFAMIQKYQEREGETESGQPRREATERPAQRAAEPAVSYDAGSDPITDAIRDTTFPELNTSTDILVMVDEAHRTQASRLHANLLISLPNCARVGFTGTPIMMGDRKRTHEIFGDFIDRYTIKQSEADGATVPILYEGRDTDATVDGAANLDELFATQFAGHSAEEIEAIKSRFATQSAVLEADDLIRAKAQDIVRHYVDCVLPNGFKAQVVGTTRRAAVRYQKAIAAALAALIVKVDALDLRLHDLDEEQLQSHSDDIRFLVRARRHRALIATIEVAAVISGNANDQATYGEWWKPEKKDLHIERFKKPLRHRDQAKRDGLAILCVKSMLLTGFDAPFEQVLYLDRFMQGAELLQTIARVNRTQENKKVGIIVDYVGLARRLKEALAVYAQEDVAGALANLADEVPALRDRHQSVVETLRSQGITDLTPSTPTVERCVDALRDMRVRAEFVTRLKQFLTTLDTVLPRPEALPFLKDAKLFGFIAQAARNRYRDTRINIVGAGEKVRQLIDLHLKAIGIDPKVAPVQITDAGFAEKTNTLGSDRTKASEMEHAVRHHIEVHFDEDPARFKKLSEKLSNILSNFRDNWAEQAKALRDLVQEAVTADPKDDTGLDPRRQKPFYGVLAEELGEPVTPETKTVRVDMVTELVDHITQEIRTVDFWKTPDFQRGLRTWLVTTIDQRNLVPSGDLGHIERLADRLIELARHNHGALINP